MTAAALTAARAAAVVARLELDLDDGIWDDGLEVQALAAARKARDAGVADSEQALTDLEARGRRSVVARAIVRRLAGELSERAARDPWLNPELNRAPPPDEAARD